MKKVLFYSFIFICSAPLMSQVHNVDLEPDVTTDASNQTNFSIEFTDVSTSNKHNYYGMIGVDGDLADAYQSAQTDKAEAAPDRTLEKEVKVIPSGSFPYTNNFVPGTLAGVTVIIPTTIETAPVIFIFSYNDKDELINVSATNRRTDIELTKVQKTTLSGSTYYICYWRYKNSKDKLTMLYAKAPR